MQTYEVNKYPLELLLCRSALILYHFSEGKEDWYEYMDLCSKIKDVYPILDDSYHKQKIAIHIILLHMFNSNSIPVLYQIIAIYVERM